MDIKTKGDAIKVIADLKTEQKRLADANRSLSENLDKKAQAIKDVQQKMAELSAPKVETVSEKEATLRKHVRADGTLDAESLINDPVDRGDWHVDLKKMVDDRNMARLMTKSGQGCAKLDERIERHMQSAPGVIKRAFSDASGVGAEWIPDLLLPELYKKLYSPTALEGAFRAMDMPGKEVRLPYMTGKVRPYLKSAATWSSITAQDDTTSQVSITAKSLAARITLDADAAEDSVIFGLDYARDSLVDSISAAVEDAIINGSLDSTHADLNTTGSPRAWNPRSRWNTADLGAAGDHRRAWDGLRAIANDQSSKYDANAISGSNPYADIMSARAVLGAPHSSGGDLLMIVSPEVMALYLLEMSQVATIDAFGPSATVLTGSLAKLAGMDVVVSSFMTADLNADGNYDGSTTSKTGYLIVDRSRYMQANYKPLTIDVDREITKGQIEVVATRRTAFVNVDGTGSKNVVFGYNIANS